MCHRLLLKIQHDRIFYFDYCDESVSPDFAGLLALPHDEVPSRLLLFFYTLFLPDGNKKNEKKSHEYLEATTSVACRGWTLEPWGHHGLGTWRTEGSL